MMKPTLKMAIGVFDIFIRLVFLLIVLIWSTIWLIRSVFESSIVTDQLNELFLGNIASLNFITFIISLLFAGATFFWFIFPLNYITFRKLKPEERFLKLKYFVYFFTFHILLVYATYYWAIIFFYSTAYGMNLPPEVNYTFNNDVIHMTEFFLSNKNFFITIDHYTLMIFVTYILYFLYVVYRIKFESGITNKIIPYLNKLEHIKVKKGTTDIVLEKFVSKVFNCKTGELYYRYYYYYFSVIWFLYPLIFTCLTVGYEARGESFAVFLATNDMFMIKSSFLMLICLVVPALIASELQATYGFHITNYISRKNINKGIDFSCKYFTILGSLYLTSLVPKTSSFLEEYANIIVAFNFKIVVTVLTFFIAEYILSKYTELEKLLLNYFVEKI